MASLRNAGAATGGLLVLVLPASAAAADDVKTSCDPAGSPCMSVYYDSATHTKVSQVDFAWHTNWGAIDANKPYRATPVMLKPDGSVVQWFREKSTTPATQSSRITSCDSYNSSATLPKLGLLHPCYRWSRIENKVPYRLSARVTWTNRDGKQQQTLIPPMDIGFKA